MYFDKLTHETNDMEILEGTGADMLLNNLFNQFEGIYDNDEEEIDKSPEEKVRI